MSRLVLLAGLCLATPYLGAAGLAAGTPVSNTADGTYAIGGTPGTLTSNTDTFVVNEVLDVAVAANDAGYVTVASPGTDAALSFSVTNQGNGTEAFALSTVVALPGDQFDPANLRIYFDNGDATFDAGTDTLYVPGVNDPVLAADASRLVFVVGDIPDLLPTGSVGLARLLAAAVTGTGPPGTTFAGAGDGGVDAVVGGGGAAAQDQNGYQVNVSAIPGLAKTDSVADPYGGTNPIPGATITYTLSFTVSAGHFANGVVVGDTVPAGTTYVSGSLALDGVPLTDAADADAGTFDGTAIAVDVGDLAGPATRVITFQATIN